MAQKNNTPAHYFIADSLPEAKPNEQYYRLGDLIEVLEQQLFPIGTFTGKIIGMRELSDSYLIPEIDANSLPEGDVSGLVPSSAEGILLGFINDYFKVGIINNLPKGDIVFLHDKIIRFRLAPKSPVRKEYLLRELMSEYVRNQARNYAIGPANQRSISKDDVLSLQILVPSLEIQDQTIFADALAGMQAANRERSQSFEKFRKNMHMMKHGIGQTVFNLQNWMHMISVARNSANSPVDENAEVGGLVKVKMGEIFDNIDTALEVLSRQVSTFDVGYGMKVTRIFLTDFIDHYIETHPRPNVHYDFQSEQYRVKKNLPFIEIDEIEGHIIEHPGQFLLEEGECTDGIDFPEEALTIIFENIISNAVAHGFTDPDKEYTIHIEYNNSEGTSYVLSISNNGVPISSYIKPYDIFIWGNTTGGKDHAGIGGYQIKDLMEEFGGKAEIISTPDEEFTVTYKLTFTKTNILYSQGFDLSH